MKAIVGVVLSACVFVASAAPASSAKKPPTLPPELEVAWKDGFVMRCPYEKSLEGIDRAALEQKAKAGDAMAALYVAIRSFWDGDAYDLPTARVWTERAAKGGVADGQLVYGEFLYFGLGGPTNDAQAVRWFTIASTNDCPIADYWLGRCYAEGRGVARDMAEAERRMRKLSEDESRLDEARGRANEWLWDHGFSPKLPRFKGMKANGTIDFNAPQPASCGDPDRAAVGFGKEGPLFLPDAKAALLVADPADNEVFRRLLGACVRPDMMGGGRYSELPEIRWAALSVVDLTLRPGYEHLREKGEMFRPSVDLAAAVRIEGETAIFTNDCFKAFKDVDLDGWDISLPRRFFMGIGKNAVALCVTRTKEGVLLFASSRKTLRRMVALYRDGRGGYSDLANSGAKAVALSVPAAGEFLTGIYGLTMYRDHFLATWFANGSQVIAQIGAASFAASLSEKGFLKLKLSFEAGSEREATLLHRPLVYYAQSFAAEASAESYVPSWAKDLMTHLRVDVKGKTVTVETHFKFEEFVSYSGAMMR